MLIGTGWKMRCELLPVAVDSFAVKGMEQNQVSFLLDERVPGQHIPRPAADGRAEDEALTFRPNRVFSLRGSIW